MLATCPDAATELILAEADRLLRLARRLTRCQADADDLVQNTLLRAYRARNRFEPGTSIRAWTSTILRRVFLTDAARRRRRGMENDSDAGEPIARTPLAGHVPTYESEADIARFVERLEDPVKRALERVPATYRAPLILAVVEDLTCAEIAARLGVPEGTVMSRIHRARESMKRDLVYVARRRNAESARRPKWRVIPRLARCASPPSRIMRPLAV